MISLKGEGVGFSGRGCLEGAGDLRARGVCAWELEHERGMEGRGHFEGAGGD